MSERKQSDSTTKFSAETNSTMNKSFPFIDKMIADTKRNIDKGLDREPKDMMMYYYIGGGVLLLALILFFALRKKKRA